jgi:MFS family permease
VGTVLAATAFVFRLPAGALVDRWNRRATLIVCDSGRAVNAAALAVVLALGHFVYAQILVVAFVEAALGVLFGPAETAALRRIVGPAQVREAAARNQSRSAVPGVLGPPVGGALLTAGRALPFAGDAVSYLVSLVCVASIRTPLGGGGSSLSLRRTLAGTVDGVRWVWGRPFLRSLLLWLLGTGFVFNSIGLLILVVARERGASPAALGGMFAITAAGGVAGALAAPAVVRRLPPRLVVVALGWLAAAATFALLAVDSAWAIGLLGAAAFLLVPAVNAIAFGAVSETADDDMQGRATSAAVQIATLATPLGPLAAGLLLGSLGARAALLVYAAALVALALAASTSRGLRSAV